VQPLVAGYLQRLKERLGDAGFACPLFLMLSSGGITELETAIRFPVRLVESGPAGGAVLACDLARRCGLDQVVSFDMGGTTAKICLIDEAAPQMARAFEVAREYRFKPGSGLPLRIPVIEMVEIGAGGGSVARIDAMKRIAVGPESAGADPGPACYGRGGEAPTVTDADVCLGAISPADFAGGRMPLEPARAEAALENEIAAPLGHEVLYAAFGVAEIVDENMANAAREHAVERGKSLGKRTMIAFGGSAPLHAARLAEKLDIDRIIVPRSAGVGSAVGFLRAPVAYEVARTSYQRLRSLDTDALNAMFAEMGREAHAVVERGAPGVARGEVRVAHMRYVGQGHEIAVEVPPRPLTPADRAFLRRAYDDAYLHKYGRLIEGIDVEVMGWSLSVASAGEEAAAEGPVEPREPPAPAGKRPLFEPEHGTRRDVPLYRRADLAPGTILAGPAVIGEDETSTLVSAPFTARISADGHIFLERRGA
jgi:N-methylhydantoinase A